MHLLPQDLRSLDETEVAEDLGQSPADLVVLSFTDSDLAAVAAAWEQGGGTFPGLRLASLARLRHPYSVDRYLETVCAHARAIVVRLLGGADYWRYGLDEIAALARARGIALAVVPGDHRADPRLDRAATLPADDLARVAGWFAEGGPQNMASLLGFLADRIGRQGRWREPEPLPPAGRIEAACRDAAPGAPRALLVGYRSHLTAGDIAPLVALADALAARGLGVTALHVTGLKDPRAIAIVAAAIAAERPGVVVNTSAFSGRLDDGGSVLDRAGVPVLQAILPVTAREAWAADARGLGAADLAMNVVLPELDGRIVARAVAFKRPTAGAGALEYAVVRHEAEPAGVAFVADLAAAWVRLGRLPAAARRVALVVSDYPAKGGRTGYAVGLDTPASVATIAAALAGAGHAVGALPAGADLMARLTGRDATGGRGDARLALGDYAALAAALPESFRAAVEDAWGPAGDDPDVQDGAFRFRVVGDANLAVAVQPDRGRGPDRKAGYHDPNRPPRHGYIAFYLWLRRRFGMDAMVHLGTHGTLEWLPGKAVAPAADCAPGLLAGAVPVIYPFIVDNPGEAAAAKRRLAAVTIGHLTPPLAAAGHHGAAAEIATLLEEYAQAQGLDRRRATLIAETILAKAETAGLMAECGVPPGADRAAALAKLDAWLCDLEELRIGDGLHVFGRAPVGEARAATIATLAAATGAAAGDIAARLDASAAAETANLLAALDGHFVPPGPAGAPGRGRLDVLPTGRNLTSIDPRAVPTATACTLGRRLAEAVMIRHAQDHGDWPRAIVVDLWGSATMRTGGDDLAQAFALLGVEPVRDAASARVSGFEVLPPARLERPRVDVTLRISGLFRDVFPAQIALFDQAARAVAALDEADDVNPLAAARRRGDLDCARIFGTAPGAYGSGVAEPLQAEAFATAADLGAAYLAASAHAYGVADDGRAAPAAFRARVAAADALVHVQDDPHQDILGADAFATHEGGFAAAAASLGRQPALYHADTTGAAPKLRSVAEEVARVVRARVTNPRWLAGQMRHGHRGAAEIAESIANLYAFAATAAVVASDQFDRVYDATLGDEAVRAFMTDANPEATRATARLFAAALSRGFWQTRRNAPPALLAALAGEAA